MLMERNCSVERLLFSRTERAKEREDKVTKEHQILKPNAQINKSQTKPNPDNKTPNSHHPDNQNRRMPQHHPESPKFAKLASEKDKTNKIQTTKKQIREAHTYEGIQISWWHL